MTEDTPSGRRGVSPLRLAPVAVLLAGLGAAYHFGALDYLSLDALRENRDWLQAQAADNPVSAIAAFMVIYAVVVALSLPAGTVLTIAGGFMFGLLTGTFAVVIGATAGAIVLFLAARFACRDLLRARAGDAIAKMEDGFRKNALSYLLVLRLVPLFPFFLVNLVPAFLGVGIRTYVLGTFFGIIPGSFVYVSIGNGLGALLDAGENPDLGIIFQPRFLIPIVGLAVLAAIPALYRKIATDRREALKR